MKIKTTTAFRALNNRHANERNAAKAFMVRPLKKDGTVSKAAITALDWQLNAFATEEQALVRKAALEAMNPGHAYTVVPA